MGAHMPELPPSKTKYAITGEPVRSKSRRSDELFKMPAGVAKMREKRAQQQSSEEEAARQIKQVIEVKPSKRVPSKDPIIPKQERITSRVR
jgi:hypothetical protein